ncbi:unnamed protein product [Closterium sp. NIES-65]|nr:unnamed protein product [Closterium sp. NIES-65]
MGHRRNSSCRGEFPFFSRYRNALNSTVRRKRCNGRIHRSHYDSLATLLLLVVYFSPTARRLGAAATAGAVLVSDKSSPGCTLSPSSVSCPEGFAVTDGGEDGAFVLNGRAYIADADRGSAALVLSASDGGSSPSSAEASEGRSAGSAFTSAALSPPLSGGGSALSFSARFTFQLEGQNEADVATGLALVITGGPNTAVGPPSLAGYGGAAFNASLAVVLSGRPPISAGVLLGGKTGGAGRWAALNPSSHDAPHLLVPGVQQHAWVDYDASHSSLLLVPGVQQHAWVDYDTSLASLRLFLGGSSPTKPAAPVLSEPVDLARALGLAPDGSCAGGGGEVAVGGGGCLFVGFTGGTEATDEAEMAAAGIAEGVASRKKTMQVIIRIFCVGFSSSSSASPGLYSPFFVLSGDAQVGPGPNFPIWLDTTTNAAGCAFSIPSLSLSLGSGPVAFEAAFSFSFAASADYNSWGSRGLAFVLTAGEKTACGRSSASNIGYGAAPNAPFAGSVALDNIGYGSAPNASFAKSIAVELRARPTACVAVVVGGLVAGDNCADSDAMALLPPEQAFTLNEPQHMWVSYDGSSGVLQVFVSPGAATKPTAPVLVAPIDVAAVLGGTAGLSVGFTGASWWTWVDDLEDHIIHSLSFEAVTPGSQQSLPPSPAPTTCHLAPSNTRLTCLGFAGRSAFRLNGYAHVGPAPSFPLVLDTGGTAGSALTLADLALSLDSSTSAATAGGGTGKTAATAAGKTSGDTATAAVAFEAAFVFSVWTETSYGYRGSRGLTFVISSGDKTACGSSKMGAIGYGGAAPGAFNGSVAVEVRSGPTSCVAVVVNGVASGDNCAAADHMTGLTGDQVGSVRVAVEVRSGPTSCVAVVVNGVASGDNCAAADHMTGLTGDQVCGEVRFNGSVAVEVRSGPTSCVAVVVNGVASGDNCAAADHMTGLTGDQVVSVRVAVEVRSGPTSCVAVVVNGVASGDNCAAADHMTGLTGDQVKIALSERQHAWVAYDGTSQSLEVYLGGSDGLKPEEPVLRASLDLVAVIGATSASVGFTAGTWWWGCGDTDDHHLIHSFSFNTVSPGFLPAAQPTQAPTCETTASSLHCTGFAGSTPFDLNGYAQLGPAPHFPLWLDSYDSVGSALSLAPLSLLTASARSSAFEAAFSFTFLADACAANVSVGRGFAFVLTSGATTALGKANASSVGYGSANGTFARSVAVEFRLCPVPCIAVSSKGVVAGDGCANAEYGVTLSDPEAFPLNTQQHAWMTYHGPSQTLSVFLGGASSASATYSDSSSASSTSSTSSSTSPPVKPAVPVLTAHVDIPAILGATSASVGFTAGTWWWQWGANERHIIHDLAFVGDHGLSPRCESHGTVSFESTQKTLLGLQGRLFLGTKVRAHVYVSNMGDRPMGVGSPTHDCLADLIPLNRPPLLPLPSLQVRAHVYVSNMEDRPMADVAVTARITYPNDTDASHCFVFSDPLLQGIDDVSGAGTILSNAFASIDWLFLPLDCAASAAPTNFQLGGSLQYTLRDPSASVIPTPSLSAAAEGTSAPPPSSPPASAPATAPAPAEAVPAEAVPAEAVPAEAVPAEAVPAEAVPAEAVPAEAVPAEAVRELVEVTSVRVTVAPPPALQVHYFVPRHVQGDDLTTPQVEAPVPVTLGALFYNAGHGTAAAITTQSLLPTASTTTTTTAVGTTTAARITTAADVGATTTSNGGTTTGDTSSAAMSFNITKTVLGNEPQPTSFSVKVGSIPPSATAMVRWTIESSLTGTFDTVTTTTTTTTSSSPLTGLSPILESVDIHNLVHVVYLPDSASDDGLPDFLVDDDGDEQPEAIYSSAGNRVLPVTAVPSAALTLGRPLFTSETRAKLTVAVDWSALAPAAAGGWAHMSFASQLPSHCWNLTAALRSNGSQLPVPFNTWSSFSSSPAAPTATAAAPAPATSTTTAPASSTPASSTPASPASDTTHILDFVSSPSYTLFFSYYDQTLSFPHLSPCFQAVMPPPPSPPQPSPFPSPSPTPPPPSKPSKASPKTLASPPPTPKSPQAPISPTPTSPESPQASPSAFPSPTPSPSPSFPPSQDFNHWDRDRDGSCSKSGGCTGSGSGSRQKTGTGQQGDGSCSKSGGCTGSGGGGRQGSSRQGGSGAGGRGGGAGRTGSGAGAGAGRGGQLGGSNSAGKVRQGKKGGGNCSGSVSGSCNGGGGGSGRNAAAASIQSAGYVVADNRERDRKRDGSGDQDRDRDRKRDGSGSSGSSSCSRSGGCTGSGSGAGRQGSEQQQSRGRGAGAGGAGSMSGGGGRQGAAGRTGAGAGKGAGAGLRGSGGGGGNCNGSGSGSGNCNGSGAGRKGSGGGGGGNCNGSGSGNCNGSGAGRKGGRKGGRGDNDDNDGDD